MYTHIISSYQKRQSLMLENLATHPYLFKIGETAIYKGERVVIIQRSLGGYQVKKEAGTVISAWISESSLSKPK